jgi:hypothetical protein
LTVAFGNALFLTNVGTAADEPIGTTVGTGTAATTPGLVASPETNFSDPD